MSREMTDDELDVCLFLSGAMAATAMTVRNTNFIKEMLNEPLDFMDDAGKARIKAVSSDINRARILLEYVLLELASLGEETKGDGEVGRDAE